MIDKGLHKWARILRKDSIEEGFLSLILVNIWEMSVLIGFLLIVLLNYLFTITLEINSSNEIRRTYTQRRMIQDKITEGCKKPINPHLISCSNITSQEGALAMDTYVVYEL